LAPREWVVDTCVLRISQDPHDPRSLDALALLHLIKASDRLAVDHGRAIVKQYMKHVPPKSHAGQWLKSMLSRADKVIFYPACLCARHRSALSALHFDPDDLVFVATASESVDKKLVSEDSDYSQTVMQYLEQNLGIHVLSIKESTQTT